MKHLLPLFVVLTLVLAGCSKSNDPEPLSQTIVRTWKAQQYDLVVDSSPTNVYTRGGKTNLFSLDAYQFNFKSDNTFVESDVDDNGKAVQYSGTWKLTNSDKNLELTYADKSIDTYDLGGLTASEMTLSQTTPVSQLSASDLADLASFGIKPKTSIGVQLKFRP